MRGRLCIHYRVGYELGQEAVLKAYGSPSAQRTLWPCRDPGRGREVGRRVVMSAELERKGDLDSAAPAQSVARQVEPGRPHAHPVPCSCCPLTCEHQSDAPCVRSVPLGGLSPSDRQEFWQ